MKCQDLFSLKNVKKNLKLSSAVVVIGALRVTGTWCAMSQHNMISIIITK